MAKWLVKGTYTVRYHIDTEVEAASSDDALEMALDDVEHDDPDDTETGDIEVEPIDAEAVAARDGVEKWRRWFTDWYVRRAGPFVTDGKAIAVLDDASFDVLGDVVADTVDQALVEKVFANAVAAGVPQAGARVMPCHVELFRLAGADRLTPFRLDSWDDVAIAGVVAWRGDRAVGVSNGFRTAPAESLRLEDVTFEEVDHG